MEDELRLLRQAHEEQARRVVAERVMAADRVRTIELQVEQRVEQLERRVKELEREVGDAHALVADARREAVDAHEQTRRHVEAARGEHDAVMRELEDFRTTPTYRLVMLVHRVLSSGPRRSR